jgi:hypothetical protein
MRIEQTDRFLESLILRMETAIAAKLHGPCTFDHWRPNPSGSSSPIFRVRAKDVSKAAGLGLEPDQFIARE